MKTTDILNVDLEQESMFAKNRSIKTISGKAEVTIPGFGREVLVINFDRLMGFYGE